MKIYDVITNKGNIIARYTNEAEARRLYELTKKQNTCLVTRNIDRPRIVRHSNGNTAVTMFFTAEKLTKNGCKIVRVFG